MFSLLSCFLKQFQAFLKAKNDKLNIITANVAIQKL